MRSGRVTGGKSPFKQKNSGFVTAHAISLSITVVHTHEDTREGSAPAARVEQQGSALSPRKPSIGAIMTSSSRHVALGVFGLPSERELPGEAQKWLFCRLPPGLADQPRALSTRRDVISFMIASSLSV